MKVVKVLQGPTARYLPATGVMLVSRSVEAFREMLTKPQRAPDEADEVMTFVHECVHHLQVLSSAYLWLDALARVNESLKVVLAPTPEERATAAEELTRRERAFRYRAFGISCADLCEGVAVLESYRARAATPAVEEFLHWRDTAFPGKGNSVYRRTFDVMAARCGNNSAFDLLPVITLLALQGNVPGQTFDYIMSHPNVKNEKLIGARAAQVAEALDCPTPSMIDVETAERLHSSQRHPTLYSALLRTLRDMGDEALENFARPHRVLHPIRECALPPLMIGAHRLGGVCQVGYGAGENKELRQLLHLFTAFAATAEKLVTGRRPFIPCFHSDCPNYESGLCAGWFVPPPEANLCRYRADIIHAAGKELHQIATDCAQLPELPAIKNLQTTDDVLKIFPGPETLLKRPDGDSPYAEAFDLLHDLDPEDNDALATFVCPNCRIMVEEWVSIRKMKRGYVTHCPQCGTPQEMGADRTSVIHLDS